MWISQNFRISCQKQSAQISPCRCRLLSLLIHTKRRQPRRTVSRFSFLMSKYVPLHPLLEDSPDGKNRTIVCVRYNNTCLGGRCVHDLAIARIDTHMSGITDDVYGCLLYTSDAADD